jgi:hypothetical protein
MSSADYVVKYVSAFDAHMCLSWWVVFSAVACCAACLVLECIRDQDTSFYGIYYCT